jgi:hypothetical protein
MVTVVFVHGISIRSEDYKLAFNRIQQALSRAIPGVVMPSCLWGDDLGARLLADGASIPRYRQTRGIEQQPETVQEEDRWEWLAEDALLELRLLALRPAGRPPEFDPRGGKPPSQLLDERIRTFTPSARLTQNFEEAGVPAGALEAGRKRVIEDPVYDQALGTSIDDLGEFRLVWARAVTAASVAARDPDLIDAKASSGLATALAGEVGEQPKGLLDDWLNQALVTVGTRMVGSRRGRYSDVVVPYIGDVLVYQGNGQRIRDRIAQCIEGGGEGNPVVLLGHSLGGIACVDLLAEKAYPAVKLLITVGSQSPLFYEMNALQKLRFGEPLPAHFPPWLNLYNLRDFLSYVAEPVFKDERVTDVEVNNRKPFPQSHGAYWSNPYVWSVIVPRVAKVAR